MGNKNSRHNIKRNNILAKYPFSDYTEENFNEFLLQITSDDANFIVTAPIQLINTNFKYKNLIFTVIDVYDDFVGMYVSSYVSNGRRYDNKKSIAWYSNYSKYDIFKKLAIFDYDNCKLYDAIHVYKYHNGPNDYLEYIGSKTRGYKYVMSHTPQLLELNMYKIECQPPPYTKI